MLFAERNREGADTTGRDARENDESMQVKMQEEEEEEESFSQRTHVLCISGMRQNNILIAHKKLDFALQMNFGPNLESSHSRCKTTNLFLSSFSFRTCTPTKPFYVHLIPFSFPCSPPPSMCPRLNHVSFRYLRPHSQRPKHSIQRAHLEFLILSISA